MQNFNNQQFSRNSFRPTPQKRNLKLIIWVIIGGILIGVVIFFLTKGPDKNPVSKNNINEVPTKVSAESSETDSSNYYPSPTPRPTLPPLDSNSNLVEEVDKNEPRDFSKDFDELRDQVK